MINKIFIFETRKLAYLDSYINKAKSLDFLPIILSNDNLSNNKKFEEFKRVYQHLSVNNFEFEMNCFARYFAIQSVLEDNESFILSDSDIYITDRLINIKNDESLINVFVGSEGFVQNGSELQISPHFSIWNRDLLNNFIDYIIKIYTQNADDKSLEKLYEYQIKRLGRTSISDMTLLYMWVNNNNIPYINSNNYNITLGIDHNISSLRDEVTTYQIAYNRKKVHIDSYSGISFILNSGQHINMSVIHFQGGYKRILHAFYLKNYFKFFAFSMYINLGRNVRRLVAKLPK